MESPSVGWWVFPLVDRMGAERAAASRETWTVLRQGFRMLPRVTKGMRRQCLRRGAPRPMATVSAKRLMAVASFSLPKT